MIPHPYDWFYQASAIIVLAVNMVFLFMIMRVSVLDIKMPGIHIFHSEKMHRKFIPLSTYTCIIRFSLARVYTDLNY